MWFYVLFTWMAYAVQFSFLTLALAAGLYYLAELVEEYSSAAARVIRYTILVTVLLYLGLWLLEGFPLLLVGMGVLAQLLHLALLRTFPVFVPASPSFIGTIVLLLVNHYLAFRYFAEEYRSFGEMLAYMTLCLWVVPFSFLVSLSANDQTLPMISHHARSGSTQYGMASFLIPNDNDVVSSYFSTKQKRGGYGLLSLFKRAKESVLPANVNQTKRYA